MHSPIFFYFVHDVFPDTPFPYPPSFGRRGRFKPTLHVLCFPPSEAPPQQHAATNQRCDTFLAPPFLPPKIMGVTMVLIQISCFKTEKPKWDVISNWFRKFKPIENYNFSWPSVSSFPPPSTTTLVRFHHIPLLHHLRVCLGAGGGGLPPPGVCCGQPHISFLIC